MGAPITFPQDNPHIRTQLQQATSTSLAQPCPSTSTAPSKSPPSGTLSSIGVGEPQNNQFKNSLSLFPRETRQPDHPSHLHLRRHPLAAHPSSLITPSAKPIARIPQSSSAYPLALNDVEALHLHQPATVTFALKTPVHPAQQLTASDTSSSDAQTLINSSANDVLRPTSAGGSTTSRPDAATGFLGSFLNDNPYFSAGFGLMGVGAGLALLRRGAVGLSTLAQRRLFVKLEMTSKDPSYGWFLQWMAAQQEAQQASTRQNGLLRGLATRSHELSVNTTSLTRADGSLSTSFALLPGPGRHFFSHKGTPFLITRERTTKLDLTTGTPFETLTLTTLSSSRHILPSLLSSAYTLAKSRNAGKTIIYTSWGPEWRPFGEPRNRRPLRSVVLPPGVEERILDDLRKFEERGEWYKERGVPYRRGYLLHGPPGSGKSSFIVALAGELERDICVMSLSERGLTDDKLMHLLLKAPERAIILIEDIDVAFRGRKGNDETGFAAITFSGLLNALDGVASSTAQRIVFMTTNHPSRLDPALVRPGRVDVRELLGDAVPSQAAELFRRFYSSSSIQIAVNSQDEVERFAQILEGKVRNSVQEEKLDGQRKGGAGVSMAALQGHFIRCEKMEDAVAGWDALLQEAREIRNRGESDGKERVPSTPGI